MTFTKQDYINGLLIASVVTMVALTPWFIHRHNLRNTHPAEHHFTQNAVPLLHCNPPKFCGMGN